jgi:hypothetical protein
MKQTIIKSGKILCKLIIIIIAGMCLYQGYIIYEYNSEHPQSKYEYNTHDVYLSHDDVNNVTIVSEGMPPELKHKLDLAKKANRTLTAGVFVGFLFLLLEFGEDPKKHIFTKWYKKLKDIDIEE